MVELTAAKGAEIKYSTVQNWYAGDENGKGGIYNFVTKRGLCHGDDSKISWTQVSCLMIDSCVVCASQSAVCAAATCLWPSGALCHAVHMNCRVVLRLIQVQDLGVLNGRIQNMSIFGTLAFMPPGISIGVSSDKNRAGKFSGRL